MLDNKHVHPSFGVITISRVSSSGTPKLFGSLAQSRNFMVIEILPAELSHDLGSDHIWPVSRVPKISVALSESQFGQLLGSANIGEGVPCTIANFNGKDVPEPPNIGTEQIRIAEAFNKRMEEIQATSRAEGKKLRELLSKEGNITKADRKDILEYLKTIERETIGNTSFAMHMFQESCENVVADAKTQINGYAAHVAESKGLKLGEVMPRLNVNA